MNIELILAEYDGMFGNQSLNDIEEYLRRNIEDAKAQSELGILFTLLNEMIGFCRDTTQKNKALKYIDELKELLTIMGLEGSVEYATSLLNIANAYRAFDMAKEAIEIFGNVLQIYQQKLSPNDFNYASLYNNWSLAYQEIGDYENAKEMLLKALAIVNTYEEAIIPQAITRTNLAASLLQMGTEKAYEEAIGYLREALDIFEKDGGRDFHYGAALVAMGDAYSYKEEFDKAAKYYLSGLKEIEKHVGRTDNYYRVLEKYEHAKEQSTTTDKWISNLERSKAFYENEGKTMIHSLFLEYENRIAVGLVGEGSDCYGFDDEISMDHDYGVGFCMWLTDEDYEKIGKELQAAYDRLVGSTEGRLSYRRGVFSISEFYGNLEEAEEYQLAELTNGMVFKDDLGLFSDVRNKLLSYYPEHIWRKKLAQSMHDFSQYAQSNYARMMGRSDGITARICIGKAMETTMDMVYLLNRTYTPYYKWKKKGLEKLGASKKILSLLECVAKLPDQSEAWEGVKYSALSINRKDKCVELFEQIAKEILSELKKQDLVTGNDTFLESYIKQILEGKNVDIVEKIIELEWKQFDKVKNEGGRADCQDDFETFSIMRKSQYLTWTEEMLMSYCNDLLSADEKGWNLIMEKYARMMKSTNPEKYLELEKNLPVLSEERTAIQEEIIKIQVAWMEEFADKYPKMAGNMRSIRTSTDSAFNTSYETYLRGELGTYSENTFVLYTGFIVGLLKENKNLALEIMENTARLYGYDSIDSAENMK